MAIVSDVEIRLRADIARLQQDMNRVRRSVDSTMNQVTRAANAARNALIGITAGIGFSELASLTDSYTKFTAQLRLATSSQQEYAQAVGDVKRISTSAQNDIAATGVLYARIIASTKELGVSQAQVAKVTETVNLALTATGAGASESASAMLQLSQAFGSGVLRGEEFNAVYEAAPELLRILARDMDVPIGKLRKLAEAGSLTSDKLVKAFSNNEVISGLRENVAQITTISGALTVFKNNLIEIIGTQAHASGSVKLITTAILGAADAIRVLMGLLGPGLKIGAAYFALFVVAPPAITATAAAMTRLGHSMAVYAMNVLIGQANTIKFNQALFGTSVAADLASGKLTKVGLALNVLFAAFVGWEIGKYIESQFVQVEIAAEVMTGELLKHWERVKFAGKVAFDALTTFAREAVARIASALASGQELIAKGFRLIGDDRMAEGIEAYAAKVREATKVEGTLAERTAETYAQMERNIKVIDLDTDRRSANALIRATVAEAADNEATRTAKAAAASATATEEAKKQAAAYRDLIRTLGDRADATAREAAGLAALTTAEQAHIDLTRQLADGKIKLNKVQEATARSLINEAGANDVLIRTNKEYADLQQQLADNARDLAADRASLIDSARQEAEQNEFLVQTFGMAEDAIIRLNAARLIEQETKRLGRELDAEEIEDLQRVISLKERSAKAVADKRELEEAKQFWTDIDKTARDTFVSIADGGKNAFQRLKDTAKNVFFDWLYQQTLKKWIVNIQANTSSVGGIRQAVSGSSSGSGSALSSASNLFSMGKAIYSGFSTGIVGSLGSTISSLGSMFGSQAVSAFGAGVTGSTFGATTALGSTGYAGTAAAGAGASAGAYAIPIAGWIAAGMTVANKLYKQGWDATNGTLNTAGKVFGSSILAFNSVLKKIGLSNSAANIFSGQATLSKLFGRKNPEIERQGIQGTFDVAGFTGKAFADILEKGGWFRSDKRYQKLADLNEAQQNSFDATITSMILAVKGFGGVLGAETSVIDGYSKAIKLTFGKDEAENEKMIAEMFAGIGDELAVRLVPSISKFQQEGETAAATLQRVATNFAAVDMILQAFGTDSQTAFHAVGVASIEARERLVALSGGLDAFASQTDFFVSNFLSQAEQIKLIQDPLNKSLDELGFAGITSADQFKQAVQGLISSGAAATEEGAKRLAGLLALGPQFKTVADYLKELSDAAAETAKNAKDAADALLAQNEATLRAAVDSAFDAVGRAVQSQRDKISAEFEALMNRIGASIETVTGRISELTRLSDAIKVSMGTVTSDAQQMASRGAARAQVQAAIAIAKASGVLPSADDLAGALSTLRLDASDQFSSLADYQREVARTNNELATLGGLTDKQLTDAQKQLAVLEAQKAQAELQYQDEMMRLDGILEWAQAEVDAINGVRNDVQSVVAAIAGLKVAAQALQQGAKPSNPRGGNLSVEQLYKTVLGREGEKAGVEFWKKAFGDVIDADEYREFIKGAQPELDLQERQRRQAEAANMASSRTMSYNTASADQKSINEQMVSFMARTTAATEQFASQLNTISGGGNALLVEQA